MAEPQLLAMSTRTWCTSPDRTSFGFAPIKPGVTAGPGKIYDADAEQYQKPFYKRTMEISKEQYDKLNEFGSSPDSHGLSMQYNGTSNSCVDFTWGGNPPFLAAAKTGTRRPRPAFALR